MTVKRVRVPLKLPEDLVAEVDAEAERLGQTRTTYIERAVTDRVRPGAPPAERGRAGTKRPTYRDMEQATDVQLHLSHDGTGLEAWGTVPGFENRYRVAIFVDGEWHLPGNTRMRPGAGVMRQIEQQHGAGGAAAALRIMQSAAADPPESIDVPLSGEPANALKPGLRHKTSAEARAGVRPIPRKPAKR